MFTNGNEDWIFKYMSVNEPVTSRIDALRERLAESRNSAARGFDQFAAKSEVDAAISSPSGSLRAMLERVKLGQETDEAVAPQLAGMPTKNRTSNIA